MAITASTVLKTKYGKLEIGFFKEGKKCCLCIYKKPWGNIPFVRIQSACLFSESIGGNDCDCSKQLHASLKYISTEGGLIIYLFQEGRGLGLEGKIKALDIQRSLRVDTATAFKKIGVTPDMRDYHLAISAMKNLKINKAIKLATNNPEKIKAVEKGGYRIHVRIKLKIRSNRYVRNYMNMKRKVLNHLENE